MKLRELKEFIEKIEDDELEIYCGDVLPMENEDTGVTFLAIESTNAFQVERGYNWYSGH